VRLARIAATSDALRATRARNAKTALLADTIRELEPDEIEAGVAFLSGELRQRQIGAGWASLRTLPEAAAEATLTVADADAQFALMAAASGPGSTTERRKLLTDLFARATAPEQQLLSGLVAGELRQGAQASLVADAIALAAGIPSADLRRALMLRGDLRAVAVVALTEGAAALAEIGLVVGRPIAPMLASPAASIEDALGQFAPASVEWKLDGARVQAHRDGEVVALFTRSLDDVTARLPEVVDAIRALPVRSLVADAEAILLRADGRPAPFQETASAFARGTSSTLVALLFDLLHLDGEDLLDRPLHERREILERIAGDAVIPRVVTDDVEVATAFYDDALARGHEGVMVKSLDAPYEAGRRGSAWLKVKRTHTLDLVVLAVEWGSGRRHGLLSNLHLGARDEATGGFVMLGKTFKGLTDALLAWQTEQLLARETHREGHVVHVRPELVVEIAFDGIQGSTRYAGGMALRFARVKGYRPDKRPDEADTIETVRAIYEGRFPG
jgi:DNA ligase-1